MSSYPVNGGVAQLGGAAVAVSTAGDFVTPSGKSCGAAVPFNNVQNSHLSWFSFYSFSVVADAIQANEVRRVDGSEIIPGMPPTQETFSHTFVAATQSFVLTSKSQSYYSLGGGVLAGALSVRVHGHMSIALPLGTSSLIPYFIYQGSWGDGVPDGSGDLLFQGTFRATEAQYFSVEVFPVTTSVGDQFQYFFDLPIIPNSGSTLIDAIGYDNNSGAHRVSGCV